MDWIKVAHVREIRRTGAEHSKESFRQDENYVIELVVSGQPTFRFITADVI
jgi:hypothetical protein